MGKKSKNTELSLIFGELFEPATFKKQLKELLTWKSLLFLFKPGAKDEKMEKRYGELHKHKTKSSISDLLKSPFFLIGLGIVFIVSTCAMFHKWIFFYSSYRFYTPEVWQSPTDPSFEHPLGLGLFARDVWGALVWGSWTSLVSAIYSMVISVIGGIILGIIAAYKGGWLDIIIVRICDIVCSFPWIILAILIVSVLGQDLKRIIISWGVLGIAGYARLIRSEIITQQSLPYVQSAKISRASEFRIMLHHILPNSVMPILVALSHDIGHRILGLACLSFLGFGAEGVTDWGRQIKENFNILEYRPWAALWPGVGLTIAVLGFNLLGEGIQGTLDTRKKKMLNSR